MAFKKVKPPLVSTRDRLLAREKNDIVRITANMERQNTAQQIAEQIAQYVRSCMNDPGDLGDSEIAPLAFGAAVEFSDYCVHIERNCVAVYYWPRPWGSVARHRLCWLYNDPGVDFICFLWDD